MSTLSLVHWGTGKRAGAALLAGVLAMLGMSTAARGQTLWTGTVDTDWTNLLNWSTFAVPTSNDTAYVDTNSGNQPVLNGGTGTADILDVGVTSASGTNTLLTVTNSGVLSVNRIIIGDSAGATGAITVDGAGSQLQVLTSAISLIGGSGNGTLTVQNGGNVTLQTTYISDGSASQGTVLVTGAGSQLNLTSSMFAGETGDATLTVSDSGMISGSGATALYLGFFGGNASLTVNGGTLQQLGSLLVGYATNGTMLESNGGNVSVGTVHVGDQDGGTGSVTVDGANMTLAHTLVVGNSGNGTMTVQNGGMVSMGDFLIEGQSSGGTGNLTVTGAGSAIRMRSTIGMYVGDAGNGTLNVTDQGLVDGGNGPVQIGASAGSTGLLLVDNATVGNVSTFSAGYAGNGTVTVQNGGRLSATTFEAGALNGSNGTVTVDGANSTLVAQDLFAGDNGNGTLAVDHGGNVTATSAYLGETSANSTGTLTVNGTGTVANIAHSLYAGQAGAANVTVTNGGNLTVGQSLWVAGSSGSTGNVTVDGAGSVLNVAGVLGGYVGNMAMTVSNGATLNATSSVGIGFYGDHANLTVDNGTIAAGSLTVGQYTNATAQVSNGSNLTLGALEVAYDAAATAVMTVDASNVTAATAIFVGRNGNGTLIIQNGGNVTTSGYYVEAGTSAGSVGNITVTGAGSVLRLAGTSPSIYLGLGGNGTLTVTNGGLLDAGNDSVSVGGSGNGTLTVDGATAQNVRGLTIGDNGTVVVQNGGNLAASYYDTNTYNGGWANLTVTGTNSTFYNLGTQAVIGDSGQANLSITAGGLVDGGAANFWAGYSAGATGFIDVNAGTLGNVSNLLLGYYGNGTLTEENGGSVTANALTLGLQANATGTVVVDGVNATLAITGSEAFIVGDAGAGNLTVTNGGSVDAYQNNVLLGNQTGGSGAVVVDGAGSSLGNIGLLAVGAEGNGTLTAQNGAHVNAGQVEIGWLSGGNGAVLLTGLGTVMNTTAVFIGDSGNGALAINSSAVWDNGGGQVDIADANGSNGSVVVNGGIFQNIGEFDVGCCGNGSLAILGGGNVTAGTMYIAVMAGNTGAVAVTGTGSILNITAGGTGLTVGEGGSGALYIGSGGTVDNQASDAIVGMNEGSYGNVTVDGGVWQNVNLLQLGLAGNVDMTVMNGGCVTTNALTLGGTNTSIANLTVTGAGSKVLLSLGSGLLVGDQGAGNLVITQGGLVDLNGSLAQLGNAAGSTGVITISNNGTLVAGDMNVGINGTANISILDGGNLSGQQVLLATNDPGSTGVITVSNATFTAATFLGVGQYGYGELDVLSGGNVTSLGTMALGSNAGSAGNVTVSGAGSVLNAEAGLEVGVDGTGNLTVANGGSVDASLLYVGESTGSGTVDVTGTNSTLLAESGIAVGFEGNGTLTVENGGTVTVPDGGEVLITALPGSNGTVNLGNNGTLQVGGADGIEAGSGVSTFNMLGGTVKVIGSDFSTAVNATLAANTTSTVNTSGYNATWSGVLDGAGGLAKDGPGMFTLSAANTYTGLTTVQQGKLNVTGSLAGDVLVQTGATLTGNGVTTGDLTTQPGGVISPAYGTGANLTAKDFTWGGSTNGNATAIFQLSLVDNTASVLALTGNFIKGTGTTFKFDFQLSGGGSPETPRVYNLITFAGLEDEGNGLFTVGDLTYTGLRPNYSGYFTLNPNSLTFTVVPEPAVGAALAGLAVLGAAAWRRRKRV